MVLSIEQGLSAKHVLIPGPLLGRERERRLPSWVIIGSAQASRTVRCDRVRGGEHFGLFPGVFGQGTPGQGRFQVSSVKCHVNHD